MKTKVEFFMGSGSAVTVFFEEDKNEITEKLGKEINSDEDDCIFVKHDEVNCIIVKKNISSIMVSKNE